MKMSAARIRSLFKRYDSAHNEVFRFAPDVAPAKRATGLSPACMASCKPSFSRLAVVDQAYRENIRRELAKAGLL